MVDIETVSVSIAAFSVVLGVIYYILNLREQKRNMKLTLDTRRINLIESMTSNLINIKGLRIWNEVVHNEWKDYEDYVRKYGSLYNPEANIKRQYL
jgi:hypothetical protein